MMHTLWNGPLMQVSGWQGVKGLHPGQGGQVVVYNGMMDCFRQTVRDEGFLALFKVGGLARGGPPMRPCACAHAHMHTFDK